MTTQRQPLVDNENGTLDRAIFSSNEVYQQELEKIFGRAWQFIGHDSLVPNPNDFFLTYMGEDPVILTRDAKGEVHAFLNMCMHRGNRVARADDGNAKNFMCTYHGWTYSNDGKLVSVPGLQEAYYGELDVDKLGLVSVAQIDSYAGFVFATWDAEAPGLEQYLGDARWYLDMMFNRSDGGTELYGPEKWILPTNWKNPTDNFSGDNYHVSVSHRSSMIARSKAVGMKPPPPDAMLNRDMGRNLDTRNGHGMVVITTDTDEEFDRILALLASRQILQDYWRGMTPEAERRLGTFRAKRLFLAVGSIFPNFSIHTGQHFVRMWLPRGPFKTECWNFVVAESSASEEVKREILTDHIRNFGISGMFEQDDMDNWRQCTESGRSPLSRRYRQHLAMGIGHEGSNQRLPGLVAPNINSEVTQRSIYRRWQEFMDAGSWKEIHTDPPTATYEGTATFQK
jgi:phenylpropionate dioxygenase-like ring-hydroxylating dioxygenase large terminal subunit